MKTQHMHALIRKSVLWSDESKFEIFVLNRCVFVTHRVGEWMITACVVPPVKNMHALISKD